jgi:CRP-like cAMP-binding protein
MNRRFGHSFIQSLDLLMPVIRGRQFDATCGASKISNLLSPHQQERLRSISKLMDCSQGEETVLKEGSAANFVYLVSHGLVRLSRSLTSGRRQVLAFMFPGDVFGFPEQGIYVNSATAMANSVLFQVPWDKLNSLMQRDAQLKSTFLVRMAFDLRQAQRRILILGQQNVSQRLATFLLDLIEHADFFDTATKQLNLPVSRFDLGDYLGTSGETVVRTFSQMEKEGLLIRLSPRRILIPDTVSLENLLLERRRTD